MFLLADEATEASTGDSCIEIKADMTVARSLIQSSQEIAHRFEEGEAYANARRHDGVLVRVTNG